MAMERMEDLSLERLVAGCNTGLCWQLIADLDSEDVRSMLTQLTMERLRRKSFEISQTLDNTESSWSQTAYTYILYYLLGKQNRNAAKRLAKAVSYNILMRENSALYKIEALLLGGAGLLEIYNDGVVAKLQQEFQHLRAKYNIIPLEAEAWQLSGIRLNNHPVLRLAQLAACIHENHLAMQNFVECHNNNDVRQLFSCRASDYWVDILSRYSNESSIANKIGSTMSNILAINAIVPLMYAYSTYVDSQTIHDKSMDLLRKLSVEDNTYTRQWHYVKPIATSAFDSQALIQLSTEYCKRRLCHECPLAKRLLYRKGKMSK